MRLERTINAGEECISPTDDVTVCRGRLETRLPGRPAAPSVPRSLFDRVFSHLHSHSSLFLLHVGSNCCAPPPGPGPVTRYGPRPGPFHSATSYICIYTVYIRARAGGREREINPLFRPQIRQIYIFEYKKEAARAGSTWPE